MAPLLAITGSTDATMPWPATSASSRVALLRPSHSRATLLHTRAAGGLRPAGDAAPAGPPAPTCRRPTDPGPRRTPQRHLAGRARSATLHTRAAGGLRPAGDAAPAGPTAHTCRRPHRPPRPTSRPATAPRRPRAECDVTPRRAQSAGGDFTPRHAQSAGPGATSPPEELTSPPPARAGRRHPHTATLPSPPQRGARRSRRGAATTHRPENVSSTPPEPLRRPRTHLAGSTDPAKRQRTLRGPRPATPRASCAGRSKLHQGGAVWTPRPCEVRPCAPPRRACGGRWPVAGRDARRSARSGRVPR